MTPSTQWIARNNHWQEKNNTQYKVQRDLQNQMYGKGWDADVLKKYDAQKVGKGEYAEVSIGSLSTTAQT